MRTFSRHPRFERLSELAEGSLSADEQRRIRRHLERCNRCRREVGLIRDIDDALLRVPIPSMPDGILEGILSRRADGVRTILPDGPVHAPASPAWRPAAVAAGAVLALSALVTVFIPGGEVRAGASTLSLATPPVSGASVAAVYEPGTLLRGRSQVRARARVWLSADPANPLTIEAGVLDAIDDRYAGAIDLPDGTGYAVIVLEDGSGTEIDANGGAFWRFDATSETGATPGVFRAKVEALEELAGLGLVPASQPLLASIEATRRYPDDAALWRLRAFHEKLATTAEVERASMLAVHRSRLTGFVRALGPAPDASTLVMLADYAEAIDANELQSELFERLESMDPDHPLLIEAMAESLYDPESWGPQTLEPADDLFRRTGGSSQWIAQIGYELAKVLGDTDALVTWGTRMWELQPELRDQVAIDFAQHPELRSEAIELLRGRLHLYETAPPFVRALHQTTSDFESELRSRTARLYAELGKALVAGGRRASGVEALDRSIEERWDSEVAALLVEHGGASSRSLAALVAADPLYQGALPDDFGFTTAELDAAHLELESRLLASLSQGRLPEDIRLRSRVGDPVEVDDGGVSLIALWRVPPHEGSDASIEFAEYVGRLTAAGVRVVVASPEIWLDETIVVANMAGARPVLDQDGRAARSFGTADVRDYVVVHDGFYSVQYDLAEATRLALLQSEIESRGR
ncbi:MAG: zf-HC2 domain-containing protein [Gemmatimonadota bacterium]|nr:zf-HC2 domain-containing protein [Gemmatimonadota bacterium]